MNDEFEQRLSRHALRSAPPEVIEDLARAIRAHQSRPEPRSHRDSAGGGAGASVWKTLGLLWAGALAMLMLSRSETDPMARSTPSLAPEQAAAVRAERMALWELAHVKESLEEPASTQTPPRHPPEPASRSRTPRPRSQLRTPASPILGHEDRPAFQPVPAESTV